MCLDVGAKPDPDVKKLLATATGSGVDMVKALFGITSVRVGVLSNGVEEHKGDLLAKELNRLLREISRDDLSYVGFVRPDDIYEGVVDLVVTDGFSGNIALLMAEGTADMYGHIIRTEYRQPFTWRSPHKWFYAQMAGPFLSDVKKRVNHQVFNGAPVLGFDITVLKGHGSSDEVGFEALFEKAYLLAK